MLQVLSHTNSCTSCQLGLVIGVLVNFIWGQPDNFMFNYFLSEALILMPRSEIQSDPMTSLGLKHAQCRSIGKLYSVVNCSGGNRTNIYMFPFLLWIKCFNTQYINFLTGCCPRPSSQSTLSSSLISCLCISLSLSYFLLFSQIPRSDPWIAVQNKNLVPTVFFLLCVLFLSENLICAYDVF